MHIICLQTPPIRCDCSIPTGQARIYGEKGESRMGWREKTPLEEETSLPAWDLSMGCVSPPPLKGLLYMTFFCLQLCSCRSMNIYLCICIYSANKSPSLYFLFCHMLTLFNQYMYHQQSWACFAVASINHTIHQSGSCKSILNVIIPVVLNR